MRNTNEADITIRPLQTHDFTPLIALFERVAAERKWIGTEPSFDHDRYREGWSRVIAGEWGAVFVACAPNVLVGYGGIHPHEEFGHVIGMLVDDRYRGRGIGHALLNALIDWARAKHLSCVRLLVFPHNEPALALYQKFGFRQEAYYPNDVTRQTGEVWDSILMVKPL
jgi:RimJ/RimL family protein N-acetyltransferase